MQAYPSIDRFTVLRWPQIGPCNLIYNARAISIGLGTILCLLTASLTLITWLVFRLGGMRTSKHKKEILNFARCGRYVARGGLRTIVTYAACRLTLKLSEENSWYVLLGRPNREQMNPQTRMDDCNLQRWYWLFSHQGTWCWKGEAYRNMATVKVFTWQGDGGPLRQYTET